MKEFIYECKNDILKIEKLEDKVSRLTGMLEDKKRELSITHEKLSHKESQFKADLHAVNASLEIQRDKNNRFLVLNEQLQQELSKSKSISSWETLTSILSMLITVTNSMLYLYSMWSGTTGIGGNNEEIMTLLRTIRATLEELQRSNLAARATSRASGETPQLTEGAFSNLNDI
jgi:hypothetical protein